MKQLTVISLSVTHKPSEPHTLSLRYERLLRQNKFEGPFHALQHLSEILGHSDKTTTLRRYVHPSIEQKQMEKCSGPKFVVKNRISEFKYYCYIVIGQVVVKHRTS